MKFVSLTAIMAYIAFAALSYDDASATAWNILYGFAVMLAVFNILNLKVKWAAGFGVIAYMVIAYKMTSSPVTTSAIATGPLYIGGLVAAALYCFGLLVTEVKKIRQPFEELPEAKT